MFRRLVRFGLLSSALAFGAIVGCALSGERVVGSGNPATEERDVGAVTEVTLAGVGDLTVKQGEAPGLEVAADDNILPLLETTTSGGGLTLRTRSGYNLSPKTPVAYTLTVKKLERVAVSGAGNATGDGLTGDGLTVKISGAGNVTLTGLKYTSLEMTLSGAGDAKLAGEVGRLTAKVSGAGGIKAGDLKAGAVDVQISGAGDATVWATDALKARVSGAGSVKYKGGPMTVERTVSGAGSVTALTGR